MLLMMWVESSRCFPVRMPSAWMIRSVVSWKASRPPSCCIRRTRKLWRVFWGRWVSSMSSRRAWCQSRLNSSCSRASSSVRLNISLRRWTPRTVCTARLGRPLSAQYIGAKSSSSIRGSASFRKTSAQLLSRRLAFFGVTRNWDCQRPLLRVSYSEHPPLPRPGAAPTTFYYIIPTLPQAGEGFLRTNQRRLPVRIAVGGVGGDIRVERCRRQSRRTLIHGTERWFCEPDGIVDGVRGCPYHHRREGWRVLWTPAV